MRIGSLDFVSDCRGRVVSAIALGLLTAMCAISYSEDAPAAQKPASTATGGKKLETITLGGGCFWCLEAAYQRIKGIEKVVSGYTGGTVKNPDYKQVCSGETGHAESVQVTFDPATVSREKVLDFFFEMHDPTTLNRQGADFGTQYRSAIFYANDEQKKAAEEALKRAQAEHKEKIVTEITKLDTFYPAENYHQNYYNLNSSAGYCRAVIAPKLKKLGLEVKPVK